MTSKIAGTIWQLEWSDGPKQVDVILAPVRECLEGLRWQIAGDPCWCRVRVNGLHDEHCQRARELYKQLEIA